MTIIDHLEQTVTCAVLGTSAHAPTSVAAVSLLEQFYALLITRLAIPTVYTQLLRADQALLEPAVTAEFAGNKNPLFERIWQEDGLRQLLIHELSATHHIDNASTEQLLINAAPLAYQELKVQANGQFLPAFLQNQQAEVRQYLPVWASAAVTPSAIAADALSDSPMHTSAAAPNLAVNLDKPQADDTSAIMSAAPADTPLSNASHANPSDHHSADDALIATKKVAARRPYSHLLVPMLLMILTVLALALIWILVIQPKYMSNEEPVVAAPVIATPEAVVPATIPVEFIVGVDNSGELYSCSATVGDANLQNALSQALRLSFGEQENICNLEVKAGVKTTLSDIDIALLPEVLTLLKGTPFARLQLQNDSITLESPDEEQLQRLLMDIRNLLPTMTVTATAPLPIVDNSAPMDDDGIDAMNGRDDDFDEPFEGTVNTGNPANTNNSNNMPSNRSPDNQQIDNVRDNGNNGNPAPRNNAPAGPISLSELDELSGTDFVAEPLHNARPVDNKIPE